MSKEFKFNTIMVHSGVFHADDVFCVAMAQYINPEIEVIRVPRISMDEIPDTTIVCDIGGGRYDHHQPDAEIAEDGHKYAACGLLFRDFWEYIFPNEKSADSFKTKYIVPIELQDNGVETNPLSMLVRSYNPSWNSTITESEAFDSAVEVVFQLIVNEVNLVKSALMAESVVKEAFNTATDKRIIVLDKFVPYKSIISADTTYKDMEFVIHPSNRGGYALNTIPDTSVECNGGFNPPRVALSRDWLGENKPLGLTFCHPALFIASFDTMEHAVDAALSLLG